MARGVSRNVGSGAAGLVLDRDRTSDIQIEEGGRVGARAGVTIGNGELLIHRDVRAGDRIGAITAIDLQSTAEMNGDCGVQRDSVGALVQSDGNILSPDGAGETGGPAAAVDGVARG